MASKQNVARSRVIDLSCWVIRQNPRPLSWWERTLVFLRTRPKPRPEYVAGYGGGFEPTLTADLTLAMKFPNQRAADDFTWEYLLRSDHFTRLKSVSASIANVP